MMQKQKYKTEIGKIIFRNFAAQVLFIVFFYASAEADTVFDTDNLTITVDGTRVTAVYDTPLSAVQLVDGVARFNFAGDLDISDQTVRVVGVRPLSIRAGNNLTTNRTTFDVSAHGINGTASGGDGGLGGDSYIRETPPIGPPINQRFGQGGAGTGWSSRHTQPTKSGNDGQAGGVSHYSGDGSGGTTGTGGYGTVTPTTPGNGGSGGSKGSSGSGGAGGVGGNSPWCSSSGGGFGFSQRACDPPTNGSAGNAGQKGEAGDNGTHGAGGTNLATGAALSGGAGGGGGGRAGQGGAGGNGGQGGGGGGGTINAITPLHNVVENFLGWSGGNGGAGGIGGQGGDTALAGDGGAGGGAIELFARGRLTIGESVNLLSRGAAGTSAIETTSRIGGPSAVGSSGVAGRSSGSNVVGGWTRGGSGGAGGSSGRGGAGGISGLGGGGAGGTIMLTGSQVDARGAKIDASGGASFDAYYQPVFQCDSGGGGTAPNCVIESGGALLTANAGGNGRAVISTHALLNGPASISGASIEQYTGPIESNPFSLNGIKTPYLLGLQGGADTFGVLADYTSDQELFSSLFANISNGLTIGRFDFHTIDLGIDYADFDLLVLANRSNIDIVSPMFGFSMTNSNHIISLHTRGWVANTAFGGNGSSVLDALHVNAIWATLVPKTSTWFNIGGSELSQFGINLQAGDIAVLSDELPVPRISEPSTSFLVLLGIICITILQMRRCFGKLN